MGRLVRSIDDLSDADVRWVMDRARWHRAGEPLTCLGRGSIVGLLFLESSLRTRVGFAAAAARIGGQAITVFEPRHSSQSMPETLHHTMRTLMGYCDVVVARLDQPLERSVVPASSETPVISGGDRGPSAEHPSQSLIDLFAIESEFGSLVGRRLAICGDLRMRSVNSLLRLLARTPPARLTLVTVPALAEGIAVPAPLGEITEFRTLSEVDDIDALYVAGIPHATVSEPDRARLRVTSDVLGRLRADAVVTCPLPVIDEITPEAMEDPRVRAFRHSDDGLFVRMALLELLLAEDPGE